MFESSLRALTSYLTTAFFFVLTVGSLGLMLFSAYWFAVLNNDIWISAQGTLLRNISLLTTLLLVFSIVAVILSLSLGHIGAFNIVYVVLGLIAVVLGFYLGMHSETSDRDRVFDQMFQFYSKDEPNIFTEEYKCSFGSSLAPGIQNCTEILIDFVHFRFQRSGTWFKLFSSCWIIGTPLLILCLLASNRYKKID